MSALEVLLTSKIKDLTADQARLAAMLKALGNPIRFQIMQTLAERQMCMTHEIVATTPLAQSTVSQHLKVLREAGLIEGEIEGPATVLIQMAYAGSKTRSKHGCRVVVRLIR